MTDMEWYGLIPVKQEDIESDFPHDHCHDPTKYEKIDSCTKTYLDSELLKSQFTDQCVGKESCELNIVSTLFNSQLEFAASG